jgi:nucleoid-associated protein YgaU
MMRKNILNGLYALVAVGAVLVIYNAFFNSNSDTESNASSKLSSYLALDKSVQEADDVDTAAVEQSAEEASGVVVTEPESTTEAEVSETPSSEESMEPTEQATTEKPEEVVVAEQPATTTATTPGTDKPETVYTVVEGDTYACIAEKYYGSLEHYVEIMASNPIYNVGFGEYSLHVGAQIVLPAIKASDLKPASSAC